MYRAPMIIDLSVASRVRILLLLRKSLMGQEASLNASEEDKLNKGSEIETYPWCRGERRGETEERQRRREKEC